MSLKAFLNLVEIQTKIASLFPFLIGILFVFHHFGEINPLNTIVFFSAMLIFDLTTTAINNYMDYQKATDNHDFDYRKERNVIGQENLSERLVLLTIISMLTVATLLGLWLVYLTNFLVLLIGILCFFIGIFYTFGPIPLSRLPLGEIFSGVTMGFGIIFLTVYANAYGLGIVGIGYEAGIFTINFHLLEILTIALVALPSILTIANLMLANNICDLEEDIRNHRYTLPYYIGKNAAVRLFRFMYYGAYLAIILAVLLGVYHPIMLLACLSIVPVKKNLQLFQARQIKSETFIVSVKNLVLINGTIVLGFILKFILYRG